MSQSEMSPQEEGVQKAHVHIDDTHEALADHINAVVSEHLIKNKGTSEFIKDAPVQLAPGLSILNEHIKAGRMPGGAEGEMIRKRIERDKAKQREETEKHVVK